MHFTAHITRIIHSTQDWGKFRQYPSNLTLALWLNIRFLDRWSCEKNGKMAAQLILQTNQIIQNYRSLASDYFRFSKRLRLRNVYRTANLTALLKIFNLVVIFFYKYCKDDTLLTYNKDNTPISFTSLWKNCASHFFVARNVASICVAQPYFLFWAYTVDYISK